MELNGKKNYEPKPEQIQDDSEWKSLISVQVNKSGKIRVHGQIHDKTLAYGLLEVARDEIQAFHIVNCGMKRNGFR